MSKQTCTLNFDFQETRIQIPVTVHFGAAEDGSEDQIMININRAQAPGLENASEREQLAAVLKRDPNFTTQAIITARTQARQILIGIQQQTGEIGAGPEAALTLSRPRALYWIPIQELEAYTAARFTMKHKNRAGEMEETPGPWLLMRRSKAENLKNCEIMPTTITAARPTLEELKEQKNQTLASVVEAIIPKLAAAPETLKRYLEPLENLIRPMRQEMGDRQALRIQLTSLSDAARKELAGALRKIGEAEPWESDDRPVFITTVSPGADTNNERGTVRNLAPKMRPWIRDLFDPRLELDSAHLHFKGGHRFTFDLAAAAGLQEPKHLTNEALKAHIDGRINDAIQTLTTLAPYLGMLTLEINMGDPRNIQATMNGISREALQLAAEKAPQEQLEPLIKTPATPGRIYTLDDLRREHEDRKLNN